MPIVFTKYHGAGNDFVLIDNRKNSFSIENPQFIVHLCNRRKGIGADGVLIIEPSLIGDCKMRIFNADGSQPSMCGNAMRCVTDFLGECNIYTNHMKNRFLIASALSQNWDPHSCLAIDSQHKSVTQIFNIEAGGRLFLCKKKGKKISINLGTPQIYHFPLQLSLHRGKVSTYVLNTGVPHAVLFVDDICEISLLEWGKEIRSHLAFAPEGVNVNFVKLNEDGSISLRTYERGVEAETLACGTGAAAAAWTAAHLYSLKDSVIVKTRCHPHEIVFQESMCFSFLTTARGDKEIEMLGTAESVFSGIIDLF